MRLSKVVLAACVIVSASCFDRAVAMPTSTSRTMGAGKRFRASSLPRVVSFRAPASTEAVITAPTPVAAVAKGAAKATAAVIVAASGPASAIGPYLRGQSALGALDDLTKREAFKSLPPAIRGPLQSERDALSVKRDKMLPEADELDDLGNNRLGNWKDRIDANLAVLEEETGRYRAAAAIFRGKCAPARDEVTWAWCVEEKKRLNTWLDTLKKRGDEHNDELARFHLESKPYDARVASIVAEIEAWEILVNALAAKVEDEIKKNVGTCTVEEWEGLDKAITALCKQTKWACTNEQSCPVLLANLNAGKNCYDARKAMMDRCFGGGNRIHQDVLAEVQNGINRCQRIYREKCGGVGAAGDLR